MRGSLKGPTSLWNSPILRNWKKLLPLFCILALYLVLLLPTVARQGISWDEQTDLDITRAYLKPGGWLIGSTSDSSQTRLPMAPVAMVYALLNTSNLITGRLVSVGVGLLTLVGIYIYCLRRFSRAAGLLACALLATSPFFLSFARVAFTESDIYLACVFAWLLVCVDRLVKQAVIGRAVLVGVVLGLALSAKATTLAILPVVWYAVYQATEVSAHGGSSPEKDARCDGSSPPHPGARGRSGDGGGFPRCSGQIQAGCGCPCSWWS